MEQKLKNILPNFNINNSNDYLANIVIPDNSHNLEYVKTEEINQNAGNY